MKEFIKKQVKNSIENHEIIVESKKKSLVFHIQNTGFLGKKYLLIKNRASGKRILKPVQNNTVEIFDNDILQICELISENEINNFLNRFDKKEVFDIYLKVKFSNFEYIKRTPYNLKNNNITSIYEKNNIILKIYPTIHSALSFNLTRDLFAQKIEKIENINNCLYIEGQLIPFNDFDFDELEIVVQELDDFDKKYFKCDYSKKNNKIGFSTKIDFDLKKEYIGSYWIFKLKLKNNDIIIRETLLNGDSLNKQKQCENKRLLSKEQAIQIDSEDKSDFLDVVSFLYAKNNKLRMKINTKEKWLKTCDIAKNKTFYEKTIKSEKIDNKLIFFESFHGKSYSHNPKYIYEKMLDLGYDKYYRFVWSYKGNLKIPGNPIIVNRDCEDYYKYLATSKYLINNISFSLKEKRKGAIYLQTTHGTPLKYMGIDIKNKSSKIVKGEIVKEPKNWNYLIASNQYAHDIFKRAFRFKNKILDTGYPANDVFYNENKENKVKKIKKLLNITSNKKIILYAPTFRDIKKNIEGEHCFEIPLNLNKLYEKFNDEYIILLRLHYLISDNIELDDKLKNFTINVSDYDDIHELLLIADMLITDYSSVFFDYAHSKKPILFFIPDFDEYKSTRGIYLDIDKDFPGPHFSNNEGLIKGIENIEKIEEDYKDKYKTFYRTYCALSHGNSSKKVIEEVFEGRVDD